MLYMRLANDPGPEFYYTEAWRQIVEEHLTLLRNAPNGTEQTVDPVMGYRHEGDLSGFLTSVGIDPRFHYVVMRVNGMKDGSELNEFTGSLIIPPENAIERLRTMAQTTYGRN